MTDREPPPDLDALMAKIDESPLGPLLRDEKKMNDMIYGLLADSDDKVTAEMGRELQAGNISLQGLGEIPAYRSVIEGGLDKVTQIDFAGMSQELDELIEQQQEKDPGRPIPQDDEDEDLFQGLWHHRDDR